MLLQVILAIRVSPIKTNNQNQDTKSTGYLNACGTAAPIISPGQEHEINFGENMVEMLMELPCKYMQFSLFI